MSQATPIISRKSLFRDGSIVQIRIWEVASSVPPSGHLYKYSLFYGREGERLIGYDNERGKGDHKHIRDEEYDYDFTTIDRLQRDFWSDVIAMRSGKL